MSFALEYLYLHLVSSFQRGLGNESRYVELSGVFLKVYELFNTNLNRISLTQHH